MHKACCLAARVSGGVGVRRGVTPGLLAPQDGADVNGALAENNRGRTTCRVGNTRMRTPRNVRGNMSAASPAATRRGRRRLTRSNDTSRSKSSEEASGRSKSDAQRDGSREGQRSSRSRIRFLVVLPCHDGARQASMRAPRRTSQSLGFAAHLGAPRVGDTCGSAAGANELPAKPPVRVNRA